MSAEKNNYGKPIYCHF